MQLPPVIHECDVNCNTLTLQNGYYVVPPHRWEHPNKPIIWTVEEFTPQWLTLHRTYPVDQVFRAQIAPEGDRSDNVTINGNPEAGLKMAWGTALNSVFGSNEERDQAPARSAYLPPVPPVAPPRPGTAPIDQPVTADQALRSGITAIQRGDPRTALSWFQVAEAKGNSRASLFIGMMYFEGAGLPKDATRALEKFEAAGNRGDHQAMMHASYLYQQGLGTPKNAERAKYWDDKEKASRDRLIPMCSNRAILDAMDNLMRQYLNRPQARPGQAFSA